MLETIAKAIHDTLAKEYEFFELCMDSKVSRLYKAAPIKEVWLDDEWCMKLVYRDNYVDITYPTPLRMVFSYQSDDESKTIDEDITVPMTIKKVMYADPEMFDWLRRFLTGALEDKGEQVVKMDMGTFLADAQKFMDNGKKGELGMPSVTIVGRRGSEIIDIDP